MSDVQFMRLALRLAGRGYGATSPNPMVGAVLVKNGKIIGQGWHRRAGEPHAEVEAIRDVQAHGRDTRGATLYVTLEPCSTQGRTPPCTEAIIAAGIKRVVVGAVDPNPKHWGRAFGILKRAGIALTYLGAAPFGVPHLRGEGNVRRPDRLKAELQTKLPGECARLNETFNHWIVHRTPFVTVKAAMTHDGKIATVSGESKWITSQQARTYAMKLRQGADAVLVGINTILADDPSLTARSGPSSEFRVPSSKLRRIILDSHARTPLDAKVVTDEHAVLTTIVVSGLAPKSRVTALKKKVRVVFAPLSGCEQFSRRARSDAPYHIDLRWLLKKLGAENVTSLLVEGGGEVNASFLLGGFAHRVAFFYAPKIVGGRDARKAVAGEGVASVADAIKLREVEWRRLGPDLLFTARVK